MSYEVGTRVIALSHTEETKVFSFGEGVYVGDLPRPGTQWPCSEEDYKMIAAIATKDDETPIEEHPFVQFYDAAVQAHPDEDPKKDRDTMIADLLADREKPLDERVKSLYEATNENPCIHLDSGDIVWGYQSWWGPVERVQARFPAGLEWVTVPVPEGNGRWRE